MAIRNIRLIGDRVLTKVCRPVDSMTEKIQTLIDDMFDTMYDACGVGLAAPQVTYIAHALADAGFPMKTDVITVAEAEEAILCTLDADKES